MARAACRSASVASGSAPRRPALRRRAPRPHGGHGHGLDQRVLHQHAFDFPRPRSRHDVAGVEPAAFPGLVRRRGVLQVAGEETVARIVAGVAHQQLAGFARGGLDARVGDDAYLRRLPRRRSSCCRWRGSLLAMMTAPAPVSVMAQASSSGKPKRASKGACSCVHAPRRSRSGCPAARPGRGLGLHQDGGHHAEVGAAPWRAIRGPGFQQRETEARLEGRAARSAPAPKPKRMPGCARARARPSSGWRASRRGATPWRVRARCPTPAARVEAVQRIRQPPVSTMAMAE